VSRKSLLFSPSTDGAAVKVNPPLAAQVPGRGGKETEQARRRRAAFSVPFQYLTYIMNILMVGGKTKKSTIKKR